MHGKYYPRCPVPGPIEPPVPFGHMGSRGAIPQKCSECRHLFEGECTRYIESVGHLLHLDHGPCGIDGPTDPVVREVPFGKSPVEIPRKCVTCAYLGIDQIHGFHCRKDAETWGDFHRGLDWGSWEPACIYLELPLPKVTTQELSRHAQRNDLMSFIKEHRRINPGLSIEEARNDFHHFRTILTGRQAVSRREP